MTENAKKMARQDRVVISDEVVMTIAGLAASQVEGVTSMSGSIGDGIAGILGRKNPAKGVKVEIADTETFIDLSIIVEYGCKIHEVAKLVQAKVRETVENMTGLKVAGINVNVVGINLNKEIKDDEEPSEPMA